MGTGLDAWLYARRSRVQDTHASLADQKDHGRAACDGNGWNLAGILEEEVSASRYARKPREDWPRLLELVRAGKISVLILWESSRGERKAGEWLSFLDLCQEHQVLIHVISHDRTYNPANHRDWKTLASEGVENDHYTRRLSVEIKRGKAGAMKRGRAPGSRAPYGYAVHYDDRTGKTAGWKIIPEEAAIVREIIADVGRQRPVHVIVAGLNARGVPTRRGGPWTRATVRYLAGNCAYAGLVLLADGSYAQRQKQEDGAEWPPILERDVWEKARAVLTSRSTGPRPGGVKHLMTNLVRCECSALLTATGPAKSTYRCETGDLNVPEEWLDGIVRYTVCTRLARKDARDLYRQEDDDRTKQLRADLDALHKRRERFLAMGADDTIDEGDLAGILAGLKPKITRIERELGAVRYVPALAEILTADDTFAAWDSMTLQARREVVTAVTTVTVLKVGKYAPAAKRLDERRVVFDWQPPAPGGASGRGHG